jgi:6-phosphogluconolactonase (cycloisomerase 2 family)
VYLGGSGLSVARLDERTGALTVTGTVEGVPNPSFLALSPDRRFLYTTNELADGTVTALDLADPWHPVVLGRASTRGAGPTHLSVHPSGRFLLTANYGDGTVAVHRLGPDGRIGEPTELVRHTGAEPHAHQVLTDPSGRWVLAVDLGADSVFVHRLDPEHGTLAPHQVLRLPAGAGPRHLAFHPDGRRAYLLGERRAEITVAAWDPEAGRLVPSQVIATSAGRNFPAEVVVSTAGRFVHASNRGENSIATFTVHGERLTLVETRPSGGDWPRHLTLGPDERWVYVANQRSDAVHWLPRDPATGHIGPAAGMVPVPGAAVVLVHYGDRP